MPDTTTPAAGAPSADDDATFWSEARARDAADRGHVADPSACGTCRDRTANGQQVEHEQCAQRATLLPAPDAPAYELLTGLSEDELRALPARFHVPVFTESATPAWWVCAVCQGDGWTTQWPCATALRHGTEVFTPEYRAEQDQARRAAELFYLRARVAQLETAAAETGALKTRVTELEAALAAATAELPQPSPEHAAVWLDDSDELWADYPTSPAGDGILPLVWASRQAVSRRELEESGVKFRRIGWHR